MAHRNSAGIDTVTLQPGPLSPGMDKLLTAGRSVLRADAVSDAGGWRLGDLLVFEEVERPARIGFVDKEGDRRSRDDLHNFAYIGERSDDGWITAPPEGWGSNPVGDRRIEIETADGTREIGCAADFDWTGEHLSINAFRLVDEATGQATTELSNDVGELNEGSSAIEADTQPGSADRWADLERLAKAATPGPWKACGTIYEHMNCELRSGRKGEGQAIAQFWDGPNAFADGQFSAAANPSTVLELIAAARAKEAGE